MGSVVGKRKNREKQDSVDGFPVGSRRRAAPSTVFEDPDESDEATLQLEPGQLGVEANWETGEILEVYAGCQAAKKGVESGWTIIKIDGHKYTEQMLDTRIEGSKKYQLTFAKGDRAHVGFRSSLVEDSDELPQRYDSHVSRVSLASEEISFQARARADFIARQRQDAGLPVPKDSSRPGSAGTDSTNPLSGRRYGSELSRPSSPGLLPEYSFGKPKPLMVDTIEEERALEELASIPTPVGAQKSPMKLNTPTPLNSIDESPKSRSGMGEKALASPRLSPGGKRGKPLKSPLATSMDTWSSDDTPSEILPHVPMHGDPFQDLVTWKLFCRPNPFLRYTEEWLEGLGPKGDGWEPDEKFLEVLKSQAATTEHEDAGEEDEIEETEQERWEREEREEAERAAVEYKASEVQRMKDLLKNSCDGWKVWLTGRNIRSELQVVGDEHGTNFKTERKKAGQKKTTIVKEKRLFQIPKYKVVEETMIYDDDERKAARKQKRVLPETKIRKIPCSELVERTVNVEVEVEDEITSQPQKTLKVKGESWFRAPLDPQTLEVWSEGKGDLQHPDGDLVCWRADFIEKALRDAAALGLEQPVVSAEDVRDWVRKDWSLLEAFRWYVEVVDIDGNRYLWSPTFVAYLWEYWQRSKLGDHVCKPEVQIAAEAKQEGTQEQLFARKPVKWPQPVKRPPRWHVPERVITRLETPELPELPYRLPHKELFKADALENRLRKQLEGTEAWDAMTGTSSRLRAVGRAVVQDRLEQAFEDVISESGNRTRKKGIGRRMKW